MPKFKKGDLVELDLSRSIDKSLLSQKIIALDLIKNCGFSPWKVRGSAPGIVVEEFVMIEDHPNWFIASRFKHFVRSPNQRNKELLEKKK
jgi:hypothetical protein